MARPWRNGSATSSPCSGPDRPHSTLTELIARPDARPRLEQWLRHWGTLDRAAAAQEGVQPLQGRGRVWRVPEASVPGGTGWVVRHYRRGGSVAAVLGDRYLRVGTPRPFLEHAASQALAEVGVPTPRVVGAAVYPAGLFYRGDLVTEWVPGSRDLADVLFGDDPGEATTAMRATGRLLRLAHDRGMVHPDLNLKNILIVQRDHDAEAMVLDLDRARVRRRTGGEPVPVGGRSRRRMIERFWRSCRKWERKRGLELRASVRQAFRQGYGDPSVTGA